MRDLEFSMFLRAAPNGFMFFLGQLARGFGKTSLYEYDFELNAPGAYTPALTLPHKPNNM